MKKIFLVLVPIVLLVFTSCSQWLDKVLGVDPREIYLLVDDVKYKTTYKSFTELQNPCVFTYPVHDDGYNRAGIIIVIYDTQKDEVFDFVYTDKIERVSEEFAAEISPNGDGSIVYTVSGEGFSHFVVMDPAKTELTWFPKTKSGEPMQNTALHKVKPKGQIIVNQFYYWEETTSSVTGEDGTEEPVYDYESAQGIYFNVVDFNKGTITSSYGVEEDSYDQSGVIPDGAGSFAFLHPYKGVLKLRSIDLGTINEYKDLEFEMDFRIQDEPEDPEDPGIPEDWFDGAGIPEGFNPEDYDPEDLPFDPDDIDIPEVEWTVTDYFKLMYLSDETMIYHRYNYTDDTLPSYHFAVVNRKTGETSVIDENEMCSSDLYPNNHTVFEYNGRFYIYISRYKDLSKENYEQHGYIYEFKTESNTFALMPGCDIPASYCESFALKGSKFYAYRYDIMDEKLGIYCYDFAAGTTTTIPFTADSFR